MKKIKEVENYVPFAISGFGELFYYWKLTETDGDVCMIDSQYRNEILEKRECTNQIYQDIVFQMTK